MVAVQAQKQAAKTDLCTPTESVNLMKNLLSTGLSCITYLRNLFEEENYEDLPQNGLMLKTVKRGITSEADTILDWIELGCFDALEKKYLRKITFGVYLDPRNPEVMEEVYEFRITYPSTEDEGLAVSLCKDNVEVLSAKTKKEIKKATQQMMRTLITLTQTLKPLPDHRLITMRLYYYDDKTPADYEPPLFKSADDIDLAFERQQVKINVGNVETSHHTLTIKIQTNMTNFEDELPDKEADAAAAISTALPAVPTAPAEQPMQIDNNSVAALTPLVAAASISAPPHAKQATAPASTSSKSKSKSTKPTKPDAPAVPAPSLHAAKAADAHIKTNGSPAPPPVAPVPQRSAEKASMSSKLKRTRKPTPTSGDSSSGGSSQPTTATAAAPLVGTSRQMTSQIDLAAKSGVGKVLNCICDRVVDGEYRPKMRIACTACGDPQHLECYGFRSPKDVPQAVWTTFKCYFCDKSQATMSDDDVQQLACERFCLMWLLDNGSHPGNKTMAHALAFSRQEHVRSICDTLVELHLLSIEMRNSRKVYALPAGLQSDPQLDRLYNRKLTRELMPPPTPPTQQEDAMEVDHVPAKSASAAKPVSTAKALEQDKQPATSTKRKNITSHDDGNKTTTSVALPSVLEQYSISASQQESADSSKRRKVSVVRTPLDL